MAAVSAYCLLLTHLCCVVHTWQHHLLVSYYHATLAVILAQFSHKGFADGMRGVVELAEASLYLQASTGKNKLEGCAVCKHALYSVCKV